MALDSGLVLKVKNSLRIKHTALDEDIQDTIQAALDDLGVCGVVVKHADDPQTMDSLILNAVKLFCKAEYTDDPVKSAEYQRRYNSLKSCLMMAEGYREVSDHE